MRAKIIFFASILIIFGLATRLFQKQILQSEYYRALAKKQYTIEREIPPIRGQIYVRDGWKTNEYYPIALNKEMYSVLAIPKNIKDPQKVASELGKILDIDEDEIFGKIDNDKPYIPPLKKRLEYEKAKEVEDEKLEGVLLLPEEWRFYPEEDLAAHVLGYVNAESSGQYGIEGYYDEELKGETKVALEGRQNISHYLGQFLTSSEQAEGSDIYLTIDRTIQYVAEEKLKKAVEKNKAKSGSIIIANPKNGEILAMASYPDYNPNNFSQIEDMDIFNDPNISKIYEPGSVFKIFCMAGALDKQKVSPQTTGVFGAKIEVGIETITNSIGQAYGKETMTQVLENSDNVAMVFVEQQLGHDDFYQYIKDFGFGALTGVDLSGEVPAEVSPLSEWQEIEGATMSFGQGIAVTPIQLVAAAGAIANGGLLLQPKIVDKIVNPSGEEKTIETRTVRQVISEKTANLLTSMMVSVVEKGYGKQAKVPGYSIAGKTGTAEIPKEKGQGYLENENIGSFLGFAPAADPAFVMLIKMDSPAGAPWAEASVAPWFGEMSSWLLHYMQIPPE